MVDFITNFKKQNKQLGKELRQIGNKIKPYLTKTYTGPFPADLKNLKDEDVSKNPLSKKPRSKKRQGKGSPGTDYSGFNSSIHKSLIKKSKLKVKPGNITKGVKGLYKPSKVGEDYPKYNSKSLSKSSPTGEYGDVRQITEDTKYGGMQKNKQGKLKSPAKVTAPKQEEKKKRFRAGPTMTSMGGMRKSGTLRGRNVK